MIEFDAISKLRAEIESDEQNAGEMQARIRTERVLAALDEIEREANERCNPLPVDADGKVVRDGDLMYNKKTGALIGSVAGTTCGAFYVYFDSKYNSVWADECTHISPKTLEGLLREYGEAYLECHNTAKNSHEAPPAIKKYELIEEYADKVRQRTSSIAENA